MSGFNFGGSFGATGGVGSQHSLFTSQAKAEADEFINEWRRENGGLTTDQRARLGREFPEALIVVDNLRRKLGASIKTYVALLHYQSSYRSANLSPKIASPPICTPKIHALFTN